MQQLKACFRPFLQDGYLARVLEDSRLSYKALAFRTVTLQDRAGILQESCKMMHSVARLFQGSFKILQDNRPQSTRVSFQIFHNMIRYLTLSSVCSTILNSK